MWWGFAGSNRSRGPGACTAVGQWAEFAGRTSTWQSGPWMCRLSAPLKHSLTL